jgi:hypothetical protein
MGNTAFLVGSSVLMNAKSRRFLSRSNAAEICKIRMLQRLYRAASGKNVRNVICSPEELFWLMSMHVSAHRSHNEIGNHRGSLHRGSRWPSCHGSRREFHALQAHPLESGFRGPRCCLNTSQSARFNPRTPWRPQLVPWNATSKLQS